MSREAKLPKPHVRPSTEEDVHELACNMRLEDMVEILHSSGSSPLDALMEGYRLSECYTVEWRGKVVLMFGVAGTKGVFGFPWMLATDELKDIARPFLREARDYLNRMQEDYPYLTQWVWAKNTVHINWLRWMGFRFDQPAPHGAYGELFIRFHKGQLCVNQQP